MPEPRLPPISGLMNVIGKPSQYEKIWFVPVLGDFSFTSQQHFLSKYADLDWLNEIQDEELYCNDALWVRARLIKLFGIHHPSGHALSTLLNFQAIAIEIIPGRKQPESITPLIVSDTLDGCIDDYGYTPLAAMAFESGVDSQLQLRIAGSFWSLLLSQPYELGIFVDYWYSDYDESMFRVECDGQRIYYDLLGAVYPEISDESEDASCEQWWPFELPRRKTHLRFKPWSQRCLRILSRPIEEHLAID